MTERNNLGQQPREVVSGNRLFLVYEGQGGSVNISPEAIDARKQFVDRVIDEIGESAPFQIIDGNLTGEIIQNPNEETVIEFVGPKNLARITVIKKQQEQSPRKWNIMNFFRRGRKNEQKRNTKRNTSKN